jgi:electron transport complex protein RnfG
MKYIKIIFVLALVSIFSAGILSVADLLSRDKIIENQKKAINQAILTIMPEAQEIKKEDGLYKIFDKNKRLTGYIFLAQGQGYQGTIKIICGISPSLDELLGIEIIESQETPGLGARINEGWFKEQFKNLNLKNKIEYTKREVTESSQIQAITGATVSSRSVVGIVNKKVEELRNTLGK